MKMKEIYKRDLTRIVLITLIVFVTTMQTIAQQLPFPKLDPGFLVSNPERSGKLNVGLNVSKSLVLTLGNAKNFQFVPVMSYATEKNDVFWIDWI